MPARRVLAVLAAICGLLGLYVLPAAAAKDAGGSAATSGSESSSQAARHAERAAERAAAKAEAAPVQPAVHPPPAEPPAAGAPPAAHGRHASPPGPPPSLAPTGQGAAGAVAHKGEHAGAQSHAERREERRSAGSSSTVPATAGSGAGAAVAKGGGESASAQAESLARKQKKEKGSGGGQKGKKERKEKGKKSPPEEKTEGSGQGGSGSEGESAEGGSGAEGSSGHTVKGKGEEVPSAPGASAATAASLALPAPGPAGGTGAASIDSALPAAAAGLSGGAATSRAARHRARHGHKALAASRSASLAAAPAIALTSLASASEAAGGSTPPGSAPSHAKHSPAKSTQPAIVKTFTKIVGVIPTPVWILIGALILLALLLGARSMLSGLRARRLERQRGQLLEDVGLLQAALLPDPPARLGPVATSAAYRPADGPGAGGDFYDVFALADGEIAVLVGDVSGHGREALPHTALLRFTVRAYLEAGLSPREALQTAGKVLEHQLADSFATVIAATYNPRERKLTYATAGHPPPVVLGDGARDAVETLTACSAPPIGAGMRTGTRQTVVSVPGPARLCFHTDGVTEARVAEGELFGAGRLAEELAALPLEAGAAALLEQVAEHTEARPDDMAACLLRVHDGQGAPAISLEQLELDGELVAAPRVERFLFDAGLSAPDVRGLLREARLRLRHADTVLLELVPSAEGPATATLAERNVIRPAALARAGA